MGLIFQQQNENYDVYVIGGLTVRVYEYLYKSQWYVGDDLLKREEIRTGWTWSNKQFSSRHYTFDEIAELEKQIQDDKNQSVNDKSFRRTWILPNEDESVLRGKNPSDDSN